MNKLLNNLTTGGHDLHFAAGILIVSAGLPARSFFAVPSLPLIGVLVLTAAVSKELYDLWIKKTKFDLTDIVWTLAGGALALLCSIPVALWTVVSVICIIYIYRTLYR